MRILSRADVQKAITMPEAIAIVKDAFAQLSNKQATVPLRVPIEIPKHSGTTLFMPAYLARTDALALKIVSVFNDNPSRGLPLIHAVVALVDAATGQIVALLEGGYLTALRTGAVSGAATDVLARHEARVAAIFGAGVQGRAQLLAVASVRTLERVYVFDSQRNQVEDFILEMRGQQGIPSDLRAAASTAEAVREADIICTATTSFTPVYDGALVKPGTHVNGIGSYTPRMQENSETMVRRADKIVVDSYEGALAEAGDLIIPLEKGIIARSNIYAELGEITSGAKPGRERDSEITFFKSVGNAVQDASVAHAILKKAEDIGLGTEVEL
jgi:ornithine cyclodeaminase/alanine dehydrogenase-like protein (mu-crystallin family)